MAYDVDFWYITKDACQITTDFLPFEKDLNITEESIYMKTDDFFQMINDYSTESLHKKMWKDLNDYLTQTGTNAKDADTRFIIATIHDKVKELQKEYEEQGAVFLE